MSNKKTKTFVQYIRDSALFGGSFDKFHPVVSFENSDGTIIAKQMHHIYEKTPMAIRKFKNGIFEKEVKLSNQWLPGALNRSNFTLDAHGNKVDIAYLKNSPNVSGRKEVKMKIKK